MSVRLSPVRVRTKDWEEGLTLCREYFYPGTVTVAGAITGIDLGLLRVSTVTAGIVRFGSRTDVEIPVLETGYHVNVALRGTFESSSGGPRLRATQDQGTVYRPDDGIRVRGWQTGTEQLLGMKFERDALELELRHLLGRDFVGSIRLEPTLDLSRGRGAQWWHLARAVTHGLHDADMLLHAQGNALMVSSLMTGLLLASEHQFRGELDAPGENCPPAVVRRAVDYIHMHAHDALTVHTIAAMAGASVRALQTGFRTHLGTTPRRYLTSVRLDRVRRDLVAGTPHSTSVATSASFWGFTHLGRFASLYRARYGELPSTTLRDGGVTAYGSEHEVHHAEGHDHREPAEGEAPPQAAIRHLR